MSVPTSQASPKRQAVADILGENAGVATGTSRTEMSGSPPGNSLECKSLSPQRKMEWQDGVSPTPNPRHAVGLASSVPASQSQIQDLVRKRQWAMTYQGRMMKSRYLEHPAHHLILGRCGGFFRPFCGLVVANEEIIISRAPSPPPVHRRV
jgi:hypothetical protein